MTIFDDIKAGTITRKAAKDYLKKESAKYTSQFVEIRSKHPNDDCIKVVRNKDFLVQIFEEKNAVRLSINRTKINKLGTNWEEGITWDEIYRIKNNLGFKDYCAVELFPPEKDLVNVANIRHIFILQESPKFMWRNGEKT